MAIRVPVVRKYHVGDHVGLEEIRAVGKVIARRGVIPGIGSDDGSGLYCVEFDGVPQNLHVEMVRIFCLCNAHAKSTRQMMRRRRKARSVDAMQQLLAEADRNCESEHIGGGEG